MEVSTPSALPACERLARITTRRRAGSIANGGDSAASIYQQNIEEMTRAKDKEIERIKARLKEAMDDVEMSEESRRELESEVEDLTAQLRRKAGEVGTLQDTHETLAGDAQRAKQAKQKFLSDLVTSKRETARWKQLCLESESRMEIVEDEAAERAGLMTQFAETAFSSCSQLGVEASALRKQVKDMQLRMDNVVELGRESLRVQQRMPAEPVTCSSHEALKEELTTMRREKNEALGALRAERAAHAALLERSHSVEAARDSALRQLAELPELEKQIDMLSRNKLGESGWQMEKQNLENMLRRKTLELSQMTKKRDKAKRREQEAVSEVAKLKSFFEQQLQPSSQLALPQPPVIVAPPSSSSSSSLIPSSRTETPISWSYPNPTPSEANRDAEVAFLRSRVRELTHQGRYASGFSTPPPGAPTAP